MSGMAQVALGAAPVAGGAVLGSLLGTLKGPDLRASIETDVELLEKIPAEDAVLRAELKRTIDCRSNWLITFVCLLIAPG
jgi:hypothetical protein